jgi:PBP1b-binding outer membrane lipoprotein LpoB
MTKPKVIYLLVLALFIAGCASDPAEPVGSTGPEVIVYRPPT